ncbi:genetic suppressor element 1-like [Dermacentor silvarum]|uniref:genetic suppressor element 1-like n=1 Tax=Dermacentor silvarum TaxID=543639 RepID=UPI0021013D62|nr:genetic suppressor element 1-like [Dermacentor silvarum]
MANQLHNSGGSTRSSCMPTPTNTRRTPIRGVQRYNEATIAYLGARSRREYEVDSRRLQIDERRLQLQIQQHSDTTRLQVMEMKERQKDREAQAEQQRLEMQKRQMEREAQAEERRLMAAERRTYIQHQESQLQIINDLFNQIKK